jgi:PAS domain S-box-containing protein
MSRLEDGLIMEVNETWLALTGYSREEALGHFAREMHIWPTTEASSRFVRELQEKGSLHGWEQDFLKKNGEVYVVQLSAQVLTLRDEKVILSTLVDITERKRAEEALQKAHDELELRIAERTEELRRAYESLKEETREREQAEEHLRQAQKMEALGTLAGGIAHDFNNLLGAVIGFTELMQEDLPEGNRGHRHAERIMEAGLRGRDLVKQMLTFSRKTDQEKKPLRLSSIVKESAKLLRASIPTTITMNVNVMSESAFILADPVQIQQVIMNLCTNAYHAMLEKGGTLDVELSDFSVGPLDGDSHGIKPGLYMKLTVRDTGTGIPAQIKDRIFDPFFTTKAVGEGTGLGLSVVMGIVKQSGGYINVESEPGKGSTFSVYFPKVAGELVADIKGKEEAPTGTERILLVDDEEALLEMGKQILTRLGYKVTSQMSSEVALALVEESPSHFDLVITDQTMPDMTGVELAEKILAIRPDIPVILCTGFSHLVDADSARATGIKGFAMKPLTKREIAKTVREVLDGNNSA